MELRDGLREGRLQRLIGDFVDTPPDVDDYVIRALEKRGSGAPKNIAQNPFDSVTTDGIADLAGNRKTQARTVAVRL